jgi:CheY-like chemotaxis protein
MSRILWLDAEPMGCTGTKHLLEDDGHEVVLTQNLEDAVASFFSNPAYKALIVEPYHTLVKSQPEKTPILRNFLKMANETSRVMVFTTLDQEYLLQDGIMSGEHYRSYHQKPQVPRKTK